MHANRSEAFSFSTALALTSNLFVLFDVCCLIETICPGIRAKPLHCPSKQKSVLLVDVHRSKIPLLKPPYNTPGVIFGRRTVRSKKDKSESMCSPTFLLTSGVENVYNIGLRAEFTGRTNTAIQT